MTDHRKAPIELPPQIRPELAEAMTADQLQGLLRQFGNLSGVIVEVVNELTPWVMKITGALFIYGDLHAWDTVIDIRDIEGADNFLTLVNSLNSAFDAAGAQHGKTPA